MNMDAIVALAKAGFTAQQIQQMAQPQPQVVPVPQMVQQVQPQVQYPQQVQQIQGPQPNVMIYPQQIQPQVQSQQYRPVLPTQQSQQPPAQQYQPVLPTEQNTDPLQGVMLQNYANPNSMNMYDVHNVVADMIGANAPIQVEGGKK